MCNEEATGTLDEIGQKDHSVTSEYRIFGPPGTGKTTNLTRQIRRAVDRYGPASVLVTSFSRAAAAELIGRDVPINPNRIGTLHSHGYHALDAPLVAESCVDEWNRENPRLGLTATKRQGKLDGEAAEEAIEQSKDGDQILQQLSRYRGLLIPIKDWPLALRQFEAKWTRYKRDLRLLDFTDLIEQCLHDVPVAPTNPTVIFADEAQDLNRMQLTPVRKGASGQTTSLSPAMTTKAFFRSPVLLRTPSSTRTFRTITRSSSSSHFACRSLCIGSRTN